ncbi:MULTISPECIES: DUF3772 domain-containing protein [Paraburkholderia]|uniref:Mechanosensitive ion channel family protein n=1 Tax=Paraburkholderia podalyriae TaxID=1938811 RepID=A0ABR7PJX2_9BURK|nr:DUF3772 domain-containing protein [Paraburkholderia podalyriae]MBC8746670.1 mechanosensitive ion channel family protein [Paraburkholderia podalyriae]
MRKVPYFVFRLALLALFSLILPTVWAATPSEFIAIAPLASPGDDTETLAILGKLQTQQDQIKQRASTAASDAQFVELQTAIQQLSARVDNLLATSLVPGRAKLQAQLDVLGPAPAAGTSVEIPAVAQQRLTMAAQRARLDAEFRQAETIRENLPKLTTQIGRLQHDHLKNQLAFRSGSILGARFWAPLLQTEPTDLERLKVFNSLITGQLQSAWQPGERLTIVLMLLLALGTWTAGAHLLERALVWFCLHRLPEGRLRRSAIALSTTLTSVAAAACAVRLFYLALTHHQPLNANLQDFASELITLALTCAMIAGLGRALLCSERPSWRLIGMADPVARAIQPFPRILAALLMLSGTVEQFNRTVDTSLQMTLLGRGLVSLVVALTIGAALLRANRVRSALAAAGEPPEARSTVAGLIHAGVAIAVVGALFSLLTGYISVARFLTYELVWVDLVLCSFYLLSRLTQDICENLFSARHASGQTIRQLFGLDDIHLEQASTVMSAVGRSLLLAVAVVALLTGGFGTTPAGLASSILEIVGGNRLRGLNIVPDHILNALLALGIGLYLLRSVRKWLDQELLPKTGMSAGMRATLLALLVNTGRVLITLLTLSILGVRWTSLAWIVSALSVGIGFGLQEIVKNFISGLILLTERPVKVGDMVSIAGVEGDIRRINVRATEIQLADRSTVIVPNSHLISQNLRNVTMGNRTQGVTTLTLTFPLNIDPEQVRDLLLAAYEAHPSILDHPAPSVMFSQLAADGITLSVTGYVRSPRVTADTKSDLLFDILKRLRAAAITLATPQTVIVRDLREADTFVHDRSPDRKGVVRTGGGYVNV